MKTALVLETNNLRRGGDVTKSLERLLQHLRPQLGTVDELVVTHDGLVDAERAHLEHAAKRCVRFVELPPGAGYYQAKNLGFDATSADVVAFGDADCWPDRHWLDRLLAPFAADPSVSVVAGRTTYRDDVLGRAATAIDFMYFPSSLGGACTRNFYANNVAFRRDTFARFRYRADPKIYRGHCQRLGMRLAAAGVPIHYQPAAHTVHRFPDTTSELLRLRMLRGADTVQMTPHFSQAFLPPKLGWLGRLGPISPLGVLATRFGFSARTLGVREPAAVGVMAAITAADAVGALAGAFGVGFGVRDGGLRDGALRYHENRDQLD